MKKEYLFRALNDVGDDLIHMAEHKRFPNQWRRWMSLAACLALVLSLSVLALPYFPMGCGASSDKSAPAEAPAADAPEMEYVMDETAAEEEAPAEMEAAAPESAPVKEEAPAEESAPAEGGESPDESVYIWVEVDGIEYEVRHSEPILEFADGVLGEVYTTVSDTNLEEFAEAQVWLVPGTEWIEEDPMLESMAIPRSIFVYDGTNWYLAELAE